MPKKSKSETPLSTNKASYRQPLQFKIEEEIKKDKLKPAEIFDDFKKNEKKKVSINNKTNKKKTTKPKSTTRSSTGY